MEIDPHTSRYRRHPRGAGTAGADGDPSPDRRSLPTGRPRGAETGDERAAGPDRGPSGSRRAARIGRSNRLEGGPVTNHAIAGSQPQAGPPNRNPLRFRSSRFSSYFTAGRRTGLWLLATVRGQLVCRLSPNAVMSLSLDSPGRPARSGMSSISEGQAMEARKMWIPIVGVPVAARERAKRDRPPFPPATGKRAQREAEELRPAGSRRIDNYLCQSERK